MAGPNVLRIRRADRLDVVQTSFDRFRRWQAIRSALQGLAFAAAIGALRLTRR